MPCLTKIMGQIRDTNSGHTHAVCCICDIDARVIEDWDVLERCSDDSVYYSAFHVGGAC